MKSIEWIERLISEKKLPSDRQAALLMGMTSQVISHHRNGRAVTLDDKYAYRLEELLNLKHGTIVLDQHAEREKDPNVSAMWRQLATSVGIFIFAICISTFSNKSLAYNEIIAKPAVTSLYIMRSLGWGCCGGKLAVSHQPLGL
jgi:hypothetical protein